MYTYIVRLSVASQLVDGTARASRDKVRYRDMSDVLQEIYRDALRDGTHFVLYPISADKTCHFPLKKSQNKKKSARKARN